MTFSDYSHKDFVPDFNGDEYTANAVLRKDGWDYYELSYDGVKRTSDYLDENNDDAQKSMQAMSDDITNLRKEDNPAIRIFSYKPEYDEDGDMQPSYECVFHGTLEEAKQDERFKDFDIENNVRESEFKYANQQDFENLYAQDLQILRKEKEFCDELSILFKQRKNTANLDKNGEQIEKMMNKIQKECPNFEKHYNNSFKQAMGIIKEREQGKTKTQSQTQYQGRSA